MYFLTVIVALSLLVGVTFNSLKLMTKYYCQEKKAYEIYTQIHFSLNAKIDNSSKSISCDLDGLFQHRITLKTNEEKFIIKYRTNSPININMKQKLVANENIIKNNKK